jgi:PAS domain S-box-containing protein
MTLGQLLKASFDSLPNAAIILDTGGNVKLWNNRAKQLFGWHSAEVIGNPIPIVPEDRRDEFRAFQDLALSGKTLHVTSIRRRRDHTLVEVYMTILPLRDQVGPVGAIMLLCEPIEEASGGVVQSFLSEQSKPEHLGAKTALAELTTREREIVDLALKGYSARTIAGQLGLREQVVRNHLHDIYRQLRVTNRAELMAMLLT